jgi:hypothetical protein
MPSLSTLKQTAFDPSLQALEADALVKASGLRVADERVRGRGAGLNMSGRFEIASREVFDDGWSSLEDLAPFKTEVQVEKPRTVITRNQSPDLSFDRSVNPYRGCEHGCVYCFATAVARLYGPVGGRGFRGQAVCQA